MTRVHARHDTIRCLAILALVISETAAAETLFCTAERASGFVYDPAEQTWKASSLSVEHRQYRVAPANEDDLVSRALKYDYQVTDAGSSKPVIQCKSVKYPDSNETTGLILCRGSLGASFNIDTQTGRYVRAQPSGYVTRQASMDSGEGPYIEIGNCAPK